MLSSVRIHDACSIGCRRTLLLLLVVSGVGLSRDGQAVFIQPPRLMMRVMSILKPSLVKVLRALVRVIRGVVGQRRPLVLRGIWRAWVLLLPSAVLLLLVVVGQVVPVVGMLASCHINWWGFVQGNWRRRWRGRQLRLVTVDSPRPS
jgi:hypothetical protein